jgi:hypothetical protein
VKRGRDKVWEYGVNETRFKKVGVKRAALTHVLADGLVHGLLGEHRARGEGQVGGECAVERLPREGQLLPGWGGGVPEG